MIAQLSGARKCDVFYLLSFARSLRNTAPEWFISALDYLMLVEISTADSPYVLHCAVNVSTNHVVYPS